MENLLALRLLQIDCDAALIAMRVVPGIEGIYTELKCRSARLAEGEPLEQRQIPVVATGAAQGV